jgi:hypothetical protein
MHACTITHKSSEDILYYTILTILYYYIEFDPFLAPLSSLPAVLALAEETKPPGTSTGMHSTGSQPTNIGWSKVNSASRTLHSLSLPLSLSF